MAQIQVTGLTFSYEGSFDTIFENVSFRLDTDWKLGFIGRNGKGKTTFLNLLLGKYEYEGTISTNMLFEYFPFQVKPEWMKEDAITVMEHLYPQYELWKICRELDFMKTDAGILYQRYETLSHGERTKLMLALLFSKDNYFLLIDEPTNHLDMPTREILVDYLKQKKGYILVSHDRWFLDACIDHVLVLNRSSIEVEAGNFTTWWENKEKRDAYEKAENEKLKGEIKRLNDAATKAAAWADKVESSKIGFDPTKEHDRSISTRAYLGAKSKAMQKRRKNLEHRQQEAISEKQKLLKDIENPVALKLNPLMHHKDSYIRMEDFSYTYNAGNPVIRNFNLEVKRGDRILLQGKNGCGKSTIIKAIMQAEGVTVLNQSEPVTFDIAGQGGTLKTASGLIVSYMSQDTSHLSGKLDTYIEKLGISNSLFKTVLRQLDFERVQFEKNMEEYSEGQKKKVLIAGSLCKEAHLYIWDEPLNYIDVFSRIQIEELVLKIQPTMILVEHDKQFGERVATKIISLSD